MSQWCGPIPFGNLSPDAWDSSLGCAFPSLLAPPWQFRPHPTPACVRPSLLSTAVQEEPGMQRLLLLCSAFWEPPAWQTARLATTLGTVRPAWRPRANPLWEALEVQRPCLVGQVCLIKRSQPETSASRRCQPGLASSLIESLLSFFFFPLSSSELGEELLFTPQIPATERNQTDAQGVLTLFWSLSCLRSPDPLFLHIFRGTD